MSTKMKVQTQINPANYQSGDGFIHHYQRLVNDVVIPYQYQVLNDNIPDVEKSHVIENFIAAGKALKGEDSGEFYGMVFQDSDAAKWLEAAAYTLGQFPNEELEKTVDEVVEIIANAQDSDGYLNTYFTVKDRDKRWKNLSEGHELYCAGHMMEAAVAYFEITQKRKLLDVMLRNVYHIHHHFITEKAEGYPGHPEVELALLKMYRATSDEKCLELAKHFINVRGVDPCYYEKEVASRDWVVWGNNPYDHDYQQSGRPVREQSDATGHSVRAVYLYTGMMDLAMEIGDAELVSACKRLWESITQKRMYLTGGIGSTVLGEAFTVDYDLPNDTAYAETCASVGLIFFASKMLECEVNSTYADVMERAFYNTVLAGMQLDGKRFFYVNPLEIIPGISGNAVTHRHDLTQRPGWYTCACCPPNVARLIASIGRYAYGENEKTIFCHLFAEGSIKFSNGLEIICQTRYPYNFTVCYNIVKGGKEMALRIPDWSSSYNITINGNITQFMTTNGYAYIPNVQTGDVIELTLDGTPKFVYATTKSHETTGKVAISRGPLVYCFEGIDNGEDVLSLGIKRGGNIKIKPFNSDLLMGTVQLEVDAVRMTVDEKLYSYTPPKEEDFTAIAVPYYTWGNRGENQMRVWMTEVR